MIGSRAGDRRPTHGRGTDARFPHTPRGSTTTLAGTPIAGAEVFLLESLDAVTTDGAGKFMLRMTAQGRSHSSLAILATHQRA